MKDFRPERNIMEIYLLHGKYPKEFSKPDKANLKAEEGSLPYKKKTHEESWYICIRTEEYNRCVFDSNAGAYLLIFVETKAHEYAFHTLLLFYAQTSL